MGIGIFKDSSILSCVKGLARPVVRINGREGYCPA